MLALQECYIISGMCGLGFLECYVILRICDPPQWNVPMECPSPYLLIVKEFQKNANNNGRNFSGIIVLTIIPRQN